MTNLRQVGWILGAGLALITASTALAQYPQCGGDLAGDCCSASLGLGCEDAECCQTVCALFPGCCEAGWTQGCANQAAELCDIGCPFPCEVAEGDCCSENSSFGCEEQSCCEIVCEKDPTCCSSNWDHSCLTDAGQLCGNLCAECGAPGIGSCCAAHADHPYCADEDCCTAVCAVNPTCCDDVWHQGCADLAATMCEDCIPPKFLCGDPDAGPCYEANGTPACDCVACCESVCGPDSYCCEVAWDEVCAENFWFKSICQDACGDFAQCGWTGAGDCCTPHAGDDCNDFGCCLAICKDDAFCCTTEWDSICALEATEVCTACGGATFESTCPGLMSSFTVQPTTFDARAPLDDDGNLIGLGTTDEPITIKLLSSIFNHDPPMNPPLDCFHLCETDDGGYDPNSVLSVTHTGDGFHTVILARAITPGAVTVLRYQGGGLITFRAHPGNVNADAVAGVTDVLEIINFLNGEGPEYSLYRLDLNHSSQVNAADVLALIDVLNGAIGGQPWNLTPKPEPTDECP